MLNSVFLVILLVILSPLADAKIDLVTLPIRDQVQLTLYNPADLTLVREQRTLTLKPGLNRLEFSWAKTLIDPTSVSLEAPNQEVKLLEVTYPPEVTGSAIWTIDSKISGKVPVQITFFTSGLRWQSFYMGTLSTDAKTMKLQNYIRVDNQSGEDYTNAQTRVVVGKVQLLDEIAKLARRSPPYGKPVEIVEPQPAAAEMMSIEEGEELRGERAKLDRLLMAAPKQIIKEGLSEYFLYTIEGHESIPYGWAKQLLSLEVADIPVQTLYRYDEERYGKELKHLLFSKNDKIHRLGQTPLPDGQVTVYRQLAEDQHLSYVGSVPMRYIPVGQEIELDLGTARQIKVEPVLMKYKTQNYLFDNKGNISGFERVQQWQLTLENNSDLPVEIEIFRHLEHPYWAIQNPPDLAGSYEQVDVDTVKYRLTVPAATQKYLLTYTLTLFEGERQQQH